MALTPNVQYFSLYLDTTAPSELSITTQPIYKSSDSNTFSFSAQGATANVSYYKVFVNTTNTAQASEFETLNWTTYAGATTITFNQASTTLKLAEGKNYVHLIMMDEVGNVSTVADSTAFIYDTKNPYNVGSDVTAYGHATGSSAGHATSTDFGVTLTVSDYDSATGGAGEDVAGVKEVEILAGTYVATGKKLTLDATQKASSKTAAGVALDIQHATLTTGDGMKTVQVQITDEIGNTSTVTCEIELDTTKPSLTTKLKKADGTTDMPTFADEKSGKLAVTIGSYDEDTYIYYECDSTGEPVGTKPTTWTACGSASFITPEVTWASYSAGIKGIAVEVKDDAGNIEKSFKTFTLDKENPVPTLTLAENQKISDKAGFNSVNVSFSATDDNNFPTSNEVKIYVKDGDNEVLVKTVQVTNGGGTKTISDTINLTYSEITAARALPAVGYATDYEFKAEVDDITGQHATKSAYTTNSLSIDIKGPTTTKGTVASYYKQTTGDIEFTGWTATEVGISTVTKYFAWVTGNATESSLPASPDWKDYASGTVAVAANTFTEGTQYLHVIHKDALDNYELANITDSDAFIYDKTIPTCTVSVPETTDSRSIIAEVTYSDGDTSIARSGVKQYKIWGDIEGASTEASATWTNVTGSPMSVNITLTRNPADAGLKTINVKVIDNAGNESVTATDTTVLETTDPVPNPDVYCGSDTGHTTSKKGKNIAESTINVKIAGEDKEANLVKYRIFSVDNGGTTPQTNKDIDFGGKESWTDLTTPAKIIEFYQDNVPILVETPAKKTLYIRLELMDDNGNIGNATISFLYDTEGPVIVVSTVDWERLSKVHQKRRNASAVEVDQYADETIFKWSADEDMMQWKVCVNVIGQTAAEAVAIPTAAGSNNISGTDYKAGQTGEAGVVTSMIKGTDLWNDPACGRDGSYEIILYGQDEGGVWSATHAITTSSPKLSGSATNTTGFGTSLGTNEEPLPTGAPAGAVVNKLLGTIESGKTATVTMDMSAYNSVDAGDSVDVYQYVEG